jgi:hypothetical protein
VETDFILSALAFSGNSLSRAELDQLIEYDSAPKTEVGRIAARTLNGLRLVTKTVKAEGPSARLTPQLLLGLETSAAAASSFREGPGRAQGDIQPPPSEYLLVALESACGWFEVQSFTELHPIEQAAIVLLRVMELQPFDNDVERPAVLAASLFTLRHEMPPLIVLPAQLDAFRAAVEEGLRMNTRPMVELAAECLDRTLGQLIAMARQMNSSP